MASTSILTTHKLTTEQWKASLFRTYQEKTFWGRFKGMSIDSPVQVSRDLTKSSGDAITFALSGTLVGAGVTGNSVLGTGDTSNEEAMSFHNQRVLIDQVRNGTRLAGKLDEKRPAFSMRNSAKDQLSEWMARNEDKALFDAINTADIINLATAATVVISADVIATMKKEAMFPSGATRKIRPIKIANGEEVFCLGLNPSDALALRQSADFKTMQIDAGVRGDSNKIFTGALGMVHGVIIYEHSEFVLGAPVLFGAQALFLAFGTEILYGEETFDYDNQTGFMIGSIRGATLAKFSDEAAASQGSHGAVVFDIVF